MIKLETKTSQLFTLLVLSVVWGSSFILMKRGLDSFDALQVGAMRMFFAALFFTPLLMRNLKKVTKENLPWLLYVSLIGNLLPAFLFTVAQTHITSSLTGMLNSLTPFFALVVGVVVFKSMIKWWNVIGVFTGLIGAVGLVVKNPNTLLDGEVRYAGLVLIATIAYGSSINIIKHKLSELSPVSVATLALCFAGPIGGVYLLFSDFSMALASPQWGESLIYILILSIVGTSLALIVFNTLIQKSSALFASSVTYIVPIFAMAWGVVDGELITTVQYLCMGVILLGVYLVNKH